MKHTSETSAQPATVQEAIEHVIAGADERDLPIKALADAANMRTSRLYAINERAKRMYVEELAALTLAAGDFGILDFIERLVGRRAFVWPSGPTKQSDSLAQLAQTAEDFARFMAEFARAHADGRITQTEVDDVCAQWDRVLADGCAAVEQMRKNAEPRAKAVLR